MQEVLAGSIRQNIFRQQNFHEEYPIILMTGRILYHYTTRAMTGKTPELMEIEGKSFIEMNVEDAEALGIKNGDKVRLTSRRGQIESTARVGTKVSKGESWMPFHFPDGNANWLTNAALDKYARIFNIKYVQFALKKRSTANLSFCCSSSRTGYKI